MVNSQSDIRPDSSAISGGHSSVGDGSLAWLLERMAGQIPETIATECGQDTITYRELSRRSNQLAGRLVQLGVGRDRIVGVSLPRSIEMVVALLAVIKAGGAYIWLDPDYPHQRLELMADDANPGLVITDVRCRSFLPENVVSKCLLLDEESETFEAESDLLPRVDRRSDDLTYLVYTSGSTGRPKGIAMPWIVLGNLLEWQFESWTQPSTARTLQFSSLNFDVSFQEIFSTLCSGGTLVIPSDEDRRDPAALLNFLRDRNVERIFLPFVALQQLAQAFQTRSVALPFLRDVITAGEQLQVTPQIRNFFQRLRGVVLHNQYGPAETHVVTSYALSGDPGSWPLLPPIGRPITNARIFLRDENQEPVQNDATGEIYIGGPVLARGYLNQPGFTSDRFILGVSGERLYRTGDLGKLLPSGDFQFLGRRDHQVKIRGVRVELGEIEAIIAHCPGVAQAAVCPRIVSAGDTRLHAYVVSDPSVPTTPGELRKYLETRVPSQLVPSAFVLVPEIPLTATGKVDRLALKSLSSPSLQDVENDAGPSMISLSETHRELVSIWETLLEHRAIGVGENFFEIGGDSLLAVQLSAEIERAFGKKLSVTSIFEHPSIEELVALILDDSPAEVSSGFEAVRTTGSKVPLFCIPTLLDLGRALGPEQPVYGFAQSEILEIVQTLEDPREVVAEVAARWLDEIRKVQPRGPYHLAGHSFGGVVAFEAAARLEEQGEKVALLALLEPDPPKPSSKTSLKWISTLPFRVLRRFFEIGPSGRFSYLIRRARLGRDQLASKFQAAASFADMEPLKKLDALVGTYRARKHNGRITLFCARDNEKGFGAVPALEWKNAAAGEIEIHDVPGDHLTIIRRPNVVTLAKILSSCIGKTPLICVFSAVLPVLHA